ncbi:fatty acyl-CoA synthetase [Gordonia sp. NPDC058843]|uniref:fatty acyl-CoA synthetase n=1 Tax=Gordonia sp. NPDC058843 TaxID=3346648 RepID=UPI0036843969
MTTASADRSRAALATHALGDIPRRSAARWPHRTAIVHRDTALTFADLDHRVDAAAAYLWSSGVHTGDRVMLLSHNCWEFPVLVFAAARIGAIAVPVNFSLTAGELAFLIDDSTPTLVVAEDSLTAVVDDALTRTSHRPSVLSAITLGDAAPSTAWTNLASELDRPRQAAPEIVVDDDLPIRIMYTSGTESRPKGVLHSSRTLMWQYMSCISSGGMEADDVEVHALPLYHCAQLDNFLITDIMLGARSIILDRPDPVAMLEAVERHRATNVFCPPTVWVALVSLLRDGQRDVTSLRKGYYGASALPIEILRELRRLLPDLRLWNFYGQTEMGSLATVLPPEQQDSRPGSAGVAALNVTTAIVDDANRSLGPGEVGEIVHRSPQVTLGYHNRPDATAEAFAGGWFHSGDLGYFDDDGYLWVVDRKKDMIKTGGENVSSREVEEALFELAGIREAAVYGVPHERWIEAVAATVVPAEGAALDPDRVIEACRGILAPYKVPKYVVLATELPKNPSGKILKRTLREEFAQRR